MTRINAGIHPKHLPNKQLLAEHREITRIPNAVKYKNINLKNLPKAFTLGTGHVRFFYDKLGYLAMRYGLLLAECKRRGYDVTDKSKAFQALPTELMNDYKPTVSDREIIIARFKERGVTIDNYQSYSLV